MKTLLVFILFVLFTPQKSTKFIVERFPTDGDSFTYNVTVDGKEYKNIDSDKLLELMCPDCYDLED